jgi:K+:H+ antiporter subunit KhtT
VGNVEETRLPGVGVRFAFTTVGGERLGVIAHRSGRRELLVYDREDPDSCEAVVGLSGDDTRTLVDLLGGSELSERIGTAIRQSLDGLELEWAELDADAAGVGRPISELGLRSRTGASVVAVVRGDETIISPRSEFTLQGGDIAVLVGSASAIGEALKLLRGA